MAGRVTVTDCSKRYERGAAAYGTLRDTLGRLFRRRSPRVQVDALCQVSLDVGAGEMLGVVGDNGAGKSTLLKVIARVTPPDSGSVVVSGRLSALIEVGAGFHPELTGAENVVLHGSILGLPRRDLKRAIPEIAEFAGLRDGMHTPVKFFSTGMYARLGFAVAVYRQPDVLLVDEVLSVGDVAFRRRCYERIAALRANGTAVLFVSHDLAAISDQAEDALWLHQGQVVARGPAAAVAADYAAARETA